MKPRRRTTCYPDRPAQRQRAWEHRPVYATAPAHLSPAPARPHHPPGLAPRPPYSR